MGAASSVSVIRYINNCYNYKHIKNRSNNKGHGEQQEYNSIININDNNTIVEYAKETIVPSSSSIAQSNNNNNNNISPSTSTSSCHLEQRYKTEYFDDTVYIKSFLNNDDANNLFEELATICEAHRSERPVNVNVKYPLWALYYGLKRNKDDGARALDRWGSYHESWCRVLEPCDSLKRVADKLRTEFNLDPNSCNSMVVNYYFDGDTTYIPAHRDTVHCLEDNSHVFCLSLGAERSFILSSNDDIGKYKYDELQIAKEWRVTHGDLVALGQKTNEDYLHCVPKEPTVSKMRISIIFRSIDKSFINLETAENKIAKYANGKEKSFKAELITTKSYLDDGEKEHIVDLINAREKIKAEKKLEKQIYSEDSKEYYFGEGLTVPKIRDVRC